MRDLVSHLEGTLGPISGGFSKDADKRALSFQIALFENGPLEGVSALCTLGLSGTHLKMGTKSVRQEYLMLFRAKFGFRNLPGILQQIGIEVLADGKGYLRGEVIGPRGELVEDSKAEALYVAAPVYFPDEFHVFRPDGGEPIVLAWLVPITRAEAKLVRERGWDEFEGLLQLRDPDLADLERESIV
jgi:hypothetical protein